MDPYLETRWGAVHASLTVRAQDQLNRVLPSDLVARAEERAVITTGESNQRTIVPDVSVIDREESPSQETSGQVALADSVCLTTDIIEIKQRYVEIRDVATGGRVITTYLAMVYRAVKPTEHWAYCLPLKERLRGVPIPLRPDDNEIALDLQALVDQVYENGRYAMDLDYTASLRPRFGSEAEWVEEIASKRWSWGRLSGGWRRRQGAFAPPGLLISQTVS